MSHAPASRPAPLTHDALRARIAMRTRLQFLYGAALAIMVVAAITAWFAPPLVATAVFVLGLAVCVFAMVRLFAVAKSLRQKVATFDEYEMHRHLRARSAAMNVGLLSLLGVMIILLCLPLLGLDGGAPPIPWTEMSRSVGMLAAAGAMGVNFAYLRVMVRGLNDDDRALIAEPTT